ncbi:type II toxin-antitoxin system RelE/ParE family toxin [Butyrivibrio sp. FCS014]|uniref:type II toxin-antitoxin system RelE/ParE family toxin n=1 Tax=Butyrivibrio sp. FCS014 TaxID=1408304 RepID=UPI000464D936|nr:type II toxin-antitoxin system RelE/ParE family toxin [Butyrivibrio sp. FCS014]
MVVEFYKLESGAKPAGEFIKSITDKELRAKMIRAIKLLEKYGTELGMPDSKYLEDGVFELRAISGNNIARCLYFFVVGNRAIVTNGYVKKTQRTPKDIIKKAKEYRLDFERRNSNGRY